eukprot:scpid99675/ scgid22134/ 
MHASNNDHVRLSFTDCRVDMAAMVTWLQRNLLSVTRARCTSTSVTSASYSHAHIVSAVQMVIRNDPRNKHSILYLCVRVLHVVCRVCSHCGAGVDARVTLSRENLTQLKCNVDFLASAKAGYDIAHQNA